MLLTLTLLLLRRIEITAFLMVSFGEYSCDYAVRKFYAENIKKVNHRK